MLQKRREIILLTGMHRCGTSALARLLNLCGAEIPGALLPASAHNPRGYWETAEGCRDQYSRSAVSRPRVERHVRGQGGLVRDLGRARLSGRRAALCSELAKATTAFF